MRGIMFIAKGNAAIIEEEMPTLTDNTMLVRTLYSGISNGTERSFLMDGNYGNGLPYPKRIAYQHVSQVVECGKNITRYQQGDILFSSTFAGHVEYHLLKEDDLLISLKPTDDLESAALLGVATVAFHNVQRAQVHQNDTVLVVGDGLIGQFAAQCAQLTGAQVILAGHHNDRVDIARSTAGIMTINTRDDTAIVDSHAPYTAILECSGADILDSLIALTGRRARARVILAGGRFDVRYNFNQAGRAEVDILHTQHFDQSDLEQVQQLFHQGDLKIRPLVRDVVPIDDAPAIFDTLRDAPQKLLGTVFKMKPS